MQTIIIYNENEVTEQKDFQNIKSEDKIWIDLVDPTDDVLQSFVTHFHLDQSAVAVELFTISPRNLRSDFWKTTHLLYYWI